MKEIGGKGESIFKQPQLKWKQLLSGNTWTGVHTYYCLYIVGSLFGPIVVLVFSFPRWRACDKWRGKLWLFWHFKFCWALGHLYSESMCECDLAWQMFDWKCAHLFRLLEWQGSASSTGYCHDFTLGNLTHVFGEKLQVSWFYRGMKWFGKLLNVIFTKFCLYM